MKENLICTMTVEEFANALNNAGLVIVKREPETRPAEPQATPAALDFSDSSRYGCGLRAIRDRYKVSHLTAQRLKDGPLAPAIYQGRRGGKFYLDFAASDAIMKERKAKKATNAQTVTA